MIIYPILIIFSIVLFELFVLLRMSKDAKEISTRSLESMRILSSSEIEDDEKEACMRRSSAEIFKTTIRFGCKFICIIFFLCLLFLPFIKYFPGLAGSMLKSLVSPVVVAILAVVVACYARMRKVVLAWL